MQRLGIRKCDDIQVMPSSEKSTQKCPFPKAASGVSAAIAVAVNSNQTNMALQSIVAPNFQVTNVSQGENQSSITLEKKLKKLKSKLQKQVYQNDSLKDSIYLFGRISQKHKENLTESLEAMRVIAESSTITESPQLSSIIQKGMKNIEYAIQTAILFKQDITDLTGQQILLAITNHVQTQTPPEASQLILKAPTSQCASGPGEKNSMQQSIQVNSFPNPLQASTQTNEKQVLNIDSNVYDMTINSKKTLKRKFQQIERFWSKKINDEYAYRPKYNNKIQKPLTNLADKKQNQFWCEEQQQQVKQESSERASNSTNTQQEWQIAKSLQHQKLTIQPTSPTQIKQAAQTSASSNWEENRLLPPISNFNPKLSQVAIINSDEVALKKREKNQLKKLRRKQKKAYEKFNITEQRTKIENQMDEGFDPTDDFESDEDELRNQANLMKTIIAPKKSKEQTEEYRMNEKVGPSKAQRPYRAGLGARTRKSKAVMAEQHLWRLLRGCRRSQGSVGS